MTLICYVLGTITAYFRGNGVNVVKNAPETAMKLHLNDRIKAVVAKNHLERITPMERMACGGLAGASAQVLGLSRTGCQQMQCLQCRIDSDLVKCHLCQVACQAGHDQQVHMRSNPCTYCVKKKSCRTSLLV